MNHYRQLTQEQRYHISALVAAGNFQNTIANLVGVHKSTISRELKRNRGKRGYRGKQAHELAVGRRSEAEKQQTMPPEIISMVTERLQLDHSPDQISGALKLQGISISHERMKSALPSSRKRSV